MSDYNVSKPLKPWIYKDPDATLDYTWDWTEFLADIVDSIAAYEMLVDESLTVVSSSRIGAVVTAFISGGTLDAKPTATCRITTTGGRIEDRSIYFRMVER
jgi:hypothetical protein